LKVAIVVVSNFTSRCVRGYKGTLLTSAMFIKDAIPPIAPLLLRFHLATCFALLSTTSQTRRRTSSLPKQSTATSPCSHMFKRRIPRSFSAYMSPINVAAPTYHCSGASKLNRMPHSPRLRPSAHPRTAPAHIFPRTFPLSHVPGASWVMGADNPGDAAGAVKL
jgi:hypothetical protein